MGAFWILIGAIVAAALSLGIAMHRPSDPPRNRGTISRPVRRAPAPVLPPVARAQADARALALRA